MKRRDGEWYGGHGGLSNGLNSVGTTVRRYVPCDMKVRWFR